jgi:hypothetical protein
MKDGATITTDEVKKTPKPVALLPGQQRAMVGTTEFISNVMTSRSKSARGASPTGTATSTRCSAHSST